MTTIVPMDAAKGGRATHIAVQAFNASEALTAVRTDPGDLELTAWHTAAGITRGACSGTQAGEAGEIALAIVGRRAVTAVRTGAGTLKLISWDVPPGLGRVTRLADSGRQAGEAALVQITPVDGSTLVTAMRAGDGALQLISWWLHDDGTLTRLGESTSRAGGVDRVAVTALGGIGNVVVTAERTARATLKMTTWSLSPDGARIDRLGEREDGRVGEIAMVRSRDDDDEDEFESGVVTAVQAEESALFSGGHLKVIAWRVGVDGRIERVGDSGRRAGRASHVAIAAAGPGSTYLTSMRNGSGDLELVAFESDPCGAVTRSGDRQQAGVREISETAVIGLPDGRALTATRLRNTLALDTWSVAATRRSASARPLAGVTSREAAVASGGRIPM